MCFIKMTDVLWDRLAMKMLLSLQQFLVESESPGSLAIRVVPLLLRAACLNTRVIPASLLVDSYCLLNAMFRWCTYPLW